MSRDTLCHPIRVETSSTPTGRHAFPAQWHRVLTPIELGTCAVTTRRKSLRIPGYDYSTPGSYFITICASDRRSRFSVVDEEGLRRTHAGIMLEQIWLELPSRFSGVEVDAFISMPDHVHGILWLPIHQNGSGVQLGAVIQAYKSLTTRHYMRGVRDLGWLAFDSRLWQKNYFEHIIRSDASLDRHREYIVSNPHRRWQKRGS